MNERTPLRTVAGVDVGSTTTKALVVDEQGKILSSDIRPTGADSRAASAKALGSALTKARLARDPAFVVSTGYGRDISARSDEQITEITCHARGVHVLMPSVRTIIDIGGQDSKVIKISGTGKVIDFAMNDKCAAGTGRFLEVMAHSLGVSLDRMGELSLNASKNIKVSSMCTVFAESEVVSLVARGEKVEDILNGVHLAIADRVASLALRVGLEPEVAITGGVAKNIGVVRALEERLAVTLRIPDEPQLTGALGAATIALERIRCKDDRFPGHP